MTIRPAEFDRRFKAHLAAVRGARGGVVTKGSAYYGDALEDEEVRQTIRDQCKALGIGGQFGPMATSGRKCLRLWDKGLRNGTE